MFQVQYVGIEVSWVYDALFDRFPDAAGRAHWEDQMRQGVKTEALANVLMTSGEWEARYGTDVSDLDFLTLLYNNLFARAPDAGGQASWAEQLAAGMSRGEVVHHFVHSGEYHEGVWAAGLAVEVTGVTPSTAALGSDMLAPS